MAAPAGRIAGYPAYGKALVSRSPHFRGAVNLSQTGGLLTAGHLKALGNKADSIALTTALDDRGRLTTTTRRIPAAGKWSTGCSTEWSVLILGPIRRENGRPPCGPRSPSPVAVHDVDGVTPGVYRWPDLRTPIHAGNQREELYRVSLQQGLSRDAAFVVITAAEVASLDDREYRAAQLAAGLVEGRLHLLAYAMGVSATGMTFLDSEIPALVGAPLDALIFTCVGVPDYRATPGGRPGTPADVRPMRHRD